MAANGTTARGEVEWENDGSPAHTVRILRGGQIVFAAREEWVAATGGWLLTRRTMTWSRAGVPVRTVTVDVNSGVTVAQHRSVPQIQALGDAVLAVLTPTVAHAATTTRVATTALPAYAMESWCLRQWALYLDSVAVASEICVAPLGIGCLGAGLLVAVALDELNECLVT